MACESLVFPSSMFKRPFVRACAITAIKVVVMSTLSILDLVYVAQYIPTRMHALVSTIVFFLATFLFGEAIFVPARANVRKAFGWIVLLYLWESLLGALLWTGFLGDVDVLLNQQFTTHLIMFPIYAAAMFAAWYDVKRLGGESRFSEGLM